MLSYSPYPTKGPFDVIPRYFMRFQSMDFLEGLQPVDESFHRYHEAKNLRLSPEQCA